MLVECRYVEGAAGKKPLSTAVQELYEQKVKILTEDEEPEIETDFEVKDRTPRNGSARARNGV